VPRFQHIAGRLVNHGSSCEKATGQGFMPTNVMSCLLLGPGLSVCMLKNVKGFVLQPKTLHFSFKLLKNKLTMQMMASTAEMMARKAKKTAKMPAFFMLLLLSVMILDDFEFIDC
jgi:hypothetical protein